MKRKPSQRRPIEHLPPGSTGTALLAYAQRFRDTTQAYRESAARLALAFDWLDTFFPSDDTFPLDETLS